MRIAVTANSLHNQHPGDTGYYINQLLSNIITQYPEHQFIFLFDGHYNDKFISAPNLTLLRVKRPAQNALSIKYWYDVKAPFALRRHKPDLWIQPDGICSLNTPVPQLLIVPGLPFLHYDKKQKFPTRGFLKRYTGSFLKRARGIITLSDFVKEDILANYPEIQPGKLHVVPPATGEVYQPVNWQEKEILKAGNADGREYFLFTGSGHAGNNIMNLLKAFSLFKKWQHSNMKLLISRPSTMVHGPWSEEDLSEKLKSYKYRDDVVLLGKQTNEQTAGIVAAAYALIHPSVFEGSGLPILPAMQSGVPVIASDIPALKETAADAALYVNPSEPDSIAQQMNLLYRDEAQRTTLINQAQERSTHYHLNQSSEKLWTAITLIAGNKNSVNP